MNKKLLLKVFKRNINNDFLKKALGELKGFNNDKIEFNKDINIALDKIEDIKLQNVLKQEPVIYEDIIKNLEESEKLLNTVKDSLKIAKENHLNIVLEIQDVDKIVKQDKVLNFNIKKDFYNDNITNLEIKKKDLLNIDNTSEHIDNTVLNLKKGLFDIEWLKPFIDFMHNNSSLVLTIGSGLILGGMWYMNNIGYINIGSMLSRLGISIFSGNKGNMRPNNSNNFIELSISQNLEVESRLNTLESQVGHSFFRQLGVKVLALLDIMLEKLKSKQQKYK